MSETAPATGALSDTEVARRIAAVRGLRDWRRLEREGMLEGPGPESVRSLVELMVRAREHRHVWEGVTSFVLFIPLGVLFFWVGLRYSVFPFLVVLPVIISIVVSGHYTTRLQRRLVAVLGQAATDEHMEVMLDALDLPGKQAKLAAERALSRIVLTVDSEYYLAVPKATRLKLYEVCPFRSPSLVEAVVGIVERTDDTDALRCMGHIAEGRTTSVTLDRRIRHRAKRCEAVLQAKLERQKREATLLRPAGATECALLRPAGAATADERLLRVPERTEHVQQIGEQA